MALTQLKYARTIQPRLVSRFARIWLVSELTNASKLERAIVGRANCGEITVRRAKPILEAPRLDGADRDDGRPTNKTRKRAEEAQAVGGLRSPHLSLRAMPDAAAVGIKIAAIIDEVINRDGGDLTAALHTMGRKQVTLPMFEAAQASRCRIAEEFEAAKDDRQGLQGISWARSQRPGEIQTPQYEAGSGSGRSHWASWKASNQVESSQPLTMQLKTTCWKLPRPLQLPVLRRPSPRRRGDAPAGAGQRLAVGGAYMGPVGKAGRPGHLE